jgi:hypothetical protein
MKQIKRILRHSEVCYISYVTFFIFSKISSEIEPINEATVSDLRLK